MGSNFPWPNLDNVNTRTFFEHCPHDWPGHAQAAAAQTKAVKAGADRSERVSVSISKMEMIWDFLRKSRVCLRL